MKLDKRNGYFGIDSEWRMGRKAQSGRCLGAGRVCNRHVYPHSNGGEGGKKQNQKQITEATYLQPQTMIQRELWGESQQQGPEENT